MPRQVQEFDGELRMTAASAAPTELGGSGFGDGYKHGAPLELEDAADSLLSPYNKCAVEAAPGFIGTRPCCG